MIKKLYYRYLYMKNRERVRVFSKIINNLPASIQPFYRQMIQQAQQFERKYRSMM